MSLDYYEDEEKEMAAEQGGGRAPTDFECPSCNAYNPAEEALAEGAEVRCHYCGSEFKVRVMDGGRIKLREI